MSMGVTGNPYSAQRHADVMNEEPMEDAAKLRLVEEVKNRAKGAFQQKDMPSAEMLYGKAISLLESVHGKAEAPLYSNRSMVRLNLNKVEGALADANKCLEVDPKFVKAYHRKAQALTRMGDFDDAVKAAKLGQEMEPDNKAFAEAIATAEKEKAADIESKARLKSEAQDPTVVLHNASTARSSAPKPKPADGEEDISMRGYKTRADGKKTSYFHTDISDEAKALIEAQGFGKPKMLDASEAAKDEAAKGGGSTWNKAGTYEEKSMAKWVDERLKASIVGTSFSLPDGKATLTAKGVSDVKGDANVSVSRGKRRHLLDVSFSVEITVEMAAGGSGTAKLLFAEVATDDEPEISLEIDGSTGQNEREILNAFAKPAGQGLQPLIVERLKSVIEEYKTK